jgi:ankyrin repeat protein
MAHGRIIVLGPMAFGHEDEEGCYASADDSRQAVDRYREMVDHYWAALDSRETLAEAYNAIITIAKDESPLAIRTRKDAIRVHGGSWDDWSGNRPAVVEVGALDAYKASRFKETTEQDVLKARRVFFDSLTGHPSYYDHAESTSLPRAKPPSHLGLLESGILKQPDIEDVPDVLHSALDKLGHVELLQGLEGLQGPMAAFKADTENVRRFPAAPERWADAVALYRACLNALPSSIGGHRPDAYRQEATVGTITTIRGVQTYCVLEPENLKWKEALHTNDEYNRRHFMGRVLHQALTYGALIRRLQLFDVLLRGLQREYFQQQKSRPGVAGPSSPSVPVASASSSHAPSDAEEQTHRLRMHVAGALSTAGLQTKPGAVADLADLFERGMRVWYDEPPDVPSQSDTPQGRLARLGVFTTKGFARDLESSLAMEAHVAPSSADREPMPSLGREESPTTPRGGPARGDSAKRKAKRNKNKVATATNDEAGGDDEDQILEEAIQANQIAEAEERERKAKLTALGKATIESICDPLVNRLQDLRTHPEHYNACLSRAVTIGNAVPIRALSRVATSMTEALHQAVSQDKRNVIGALIEHGAKIEGIFKEVTPLGRACIHNHYYVAEALVRSKANVDACGSSNGYTPLMLSNPVYEDDDDDTTVEAALKNAVDCMHLLLAARAAPNLVDNQLGRTALMQVVENDDWWRCVQTLIKGKADLDIKDRNQTTALMIATQHHCKTQVDTLLWSKADAEAENREGLTALDMACRDKNQYLVQEIAKWGRFREGMHGRLKQAIEDAGIRNFVPEFNSFDWVVDRIGDIVKEVMIGNILHFDDFEGLVARTKTIVNDRTEIVRDMITKYDENLSEEARQRFVKKDVAKVISFHIWDYGIGARFSIGYCAPREIWDE